MQDDETWLHELVSEGVATLRLTHTQVILVNNFDRNVDGFSGLLKLDAHLVHSINDTFATLLKKTYWLFIHTQESLCVAISGLH